MPDDNAPENAPHVPAAAWLDNHLDDFLPAFATAPRWVVGFSGGLDSTVLLQLLFDWCSRHALAPPLAAIHVNHQMQSPAEDWQARCTAFCRERDIPLQVCTVSVEGAGEADARRARYAAFEEVLGAGDVLFLAHHLDDQVETFFLRLLRGAGLEGLSAIPASRSLGRAVLARPLLAVSREIIAAYAQRRALPYVDDPSNADTAIDRNFLRAQVLPLLATRWPGYRATVTRAAGHMETAARALASGAPQPAECTSVTGERGLALAALPTEHPEQGARALRDWLRARQLLAPSRALLHEFLRQLAASGSEAAPQLQTGDYTLVRFGEGVFLLPDLEDLPPDMRLSLLPGEETPVPGVGVCGLRRAAVGESGLLLREGDVLDLRWRSGGERCRPQGRSGSTSLKKYLQEIAIPPWWRDRVPLFYLEDELLAIGDLTLCQSSRLGAADKADGEALWQPVWRREIVAVD
ncbi:MAG: tRNA lysidine(34) synthetase TilS [Halioglobus sp.]